MNGWMDGSFMNFGLRRYTFTSSVFVVLISTINKVGYDLVYPARYIPEAHLPFSYKSILVNKDNLSHFISFHLLVLIPILLRWAWQQAASSGYL